jgi:hypothetical protein
MPKPKSVAFIYGWSEGSWHSKILERKLAAEGIRTTRNIERAEVIFCHSTGCYLIPKNVQAKKIILVGLPYWPERSLIYSGISKVLEDFKNTRKDMGLSWWLDKTIHNCWYMLKYPRDTLFVATKHKTENLPDPHKHEVILVRNDDDRFCHPDITKILELAKNYKFVQMPSGHDDCWSGKNSYVELIKQV